MILKSFYNKCIQTHGTWSTLFNKCRNRNDKITVLYQRANTHPRLIVSNSMRKILARIPTSNSLNTNPKTKKIRTKILHKRPATSHMQNPFRAVFTLSMTYSLFNKIKTLKIEKSTETLSSSFKPIQLSFLLDQIVITYFYILRPFLLFCIFMLHYFRNLPGILG